MASATIRRITEERESTPPRVRAIQPVPLLGRELHGERGHQRDMGDLA